jgi:hypothetical protein
MASSKRRGRSRHQPLQDTLSFWKDRAGVSPVVFVLSCVVLVSGLLLGGNAGWFGDTIVQLLALPLIVLASIEWSRSRLEATDWIAIALVGGIVLLGCFQLMPISASAWAAMPARADLLTSLHTAGTAPAWYSISLNPYATERSLQWTLPAIAMLLAVRWMSERQRRVLLLVLFSATFLLIMIGLTHSAAPQGDVLASASEAIATANLALNSASNAATTTTPGVQPVFGMFSNHNHFATLLAMNIPMVAAIGLLAWHKRNESKSTAWISWVSTMALLVFGLLIGLVQTHSRAAIALGPLALACSLLLFRRLGLKRNVILAATATALAAVAIAIHLAGSTTVARFDQSASSDMRWQIHTTTLEAAHHFGPLGSGLGTFVEAYQQVTPAEGYLPDYINHAHGDYHELWLETGIPGMILVAAFLGWFGWSAFLVWRGSGSSVSVRMLSRAATLSVALVLLHSYLDYPLRRTAVLVVFGLACALTRPAKEFLKTRALNRSPGGSARAVQVKDVPPPHAPAVEPAADPA